MRAFGLADDVAMLAKVNDHRGKLLLTDGLWVPPEFRVFPFTDESALLLSYIDRRGYGRWPDIVVDPATGCANHPIGSGIPLPWLALDVNPRALGFASINGLINGTRQLTLVWNDIRRGLPLVLSGYVGRRVLFVINMPFGLAPPSAPGTGSHDRNLPLSSDGGSTGAEMSFAALAAIRELVEVHPEFHARVVMLCYSMGNRRDGRWQVVQRAEEQFGRERVSWELQREQTMWRVNGVKSEPNPMALAVGLPKRADCRYYVRGKDPAKVRAEYVDLAARLHEAGWESLGYGIIDIDIGGES